MINYSADDYIGLDDLSYAWELAEIEQDVRVIPGIKVSKEQVDFNAVSWERMWGDSPEGYASTNVVALGEARDGRWVVVEGWCDTTGWDCQAGGWITYADTRDNAIKFALDDESRKRLQV
jgi:hypothetical protein